MLLFASQNLTTGTVEATLLTTLNTLRGGGFLRTNAQNMLLTALADAGYSSTVPLCDLQSIGTRLVSRGHLTADELNRIIAGT